MQHGVQPFFTSSILLAGVELSHSARVRCEKEVEIKFEYFIEQTIQIHGRNRRVIASGIALVFQSLQKKSVSAVSIQK